MSLFLKRSLFKMQDLSTRLLFGKEKVFAASHFYDIKDRNMNGVDIKMDSYSGAVLCVVNLVKLYDEYNSQGFKVLAFPCNQFGAQEPGTDEEILKFASKYGADKKFEWFTKGHVNGAHTREVYSFLKEKLTGDDGTKDIRWNFTTFLIDHEGNPTTRFSGTKAVYDQLKPIVEELLQKKNGLSK